MANKNISGFILFNKKFLYSYLLIWTDIVISEKISSSDRSANELSKVRFILMTCSVSYARYLRLSDEDTGLGENKSSKISLQMRNGKWECANNSSRITSLYQKQSSSFSSEQYNFHSFC